MNFVCIFVIAFSGKNVGFKVANYVLRPLISIVVIDTDFSERILKSEISLIKSNFETAIINNEVPIRIDLLISSNLAQF